ncbi:RNA polymerase sigma factor [Ferrimonas pelagia]|uniref:RNA polymerase sigma factor n=1 Tax=Ferrimonas pelagia TaxID=1177826 RepID=A0ABP9F9E4_9GAMM
MLPAPQETDEPDTEGLWIARAQRGDTAAFERLYRRHHGRIFALCYRLCGQAGQAEDATQEIFIRLWQKLPQYRFEARFSTWLHRLALNHALNHQHKQRWWRRLLPLDGQPESSAPEPALQPLDRALPHLPPRPRQVFVLYAIEGYRHAEIGELLGISEGASKAHYHRARQQLKELL